MHMLKLVPPLRVPLPSNVQETLTNWLDEAHQTVGPGVERQSPHNSGVSGEDAPNQHKQQRDHNNIPAFTSVECRDDLFKMNSLRDQLCQRITASNSFEEATELVSVMHEYYAMLTVCEDRGFPSLHGAPSIHFMWDAAYSDKVDNHENSRNNEVPFHVQSGLLLERSSILWNLAALEAQIASDQVVLSSSKGWMKANKHFQNAFSFVHHLKNLLVDNHVDTEPSIPIEFQSNMITFWENALQAQAQMAGYEKAKATTRPKHLLLSKLAKATVHLWDAAGESCSTLTTHEKEWWILRCKIWSSFMNSKAEWHEAMSHSEKNQPLHELVRIENSLTYGGTCYDYVTKERTDQQLKLELQTFLRDLQARYTQAVQRLGTNPIPNDLREIRGELLSKGATPLPLTMMKPSTPMFDTVLVPAARIAMETFNRGMKAFVLQMSVLVNQNTEYAQKALASANLPHSLTAYKQEQSGGGLPMELWERVECIQRDRKVSRLKQELWELRDVAEQARMIFSKTEKQLTEDVEMDRLFREQHLLFDGLDVREIQNAFLKSLASYEALLKKSKEGDAVLLQRLEVLDKDPKFKLLQFTKSQLDRLLPGVSDAPTVIDVCLSRRLVELSNLISDRVDKLKFLKDEVKNYNIRGIVLSVNPESPNAEQEYEYAVKKSQKSFSGIVYEIQHNFRKQQTLLDTIMEENEQFKTLRRIEGGTNHNSSESCIVMIEDAIEEIDHLAKHLREGKDFYEIVIPKLENLKQQVGDASVRLTVDRCEYEDNHTDTASRRQQELDDARMAASLAGNNSNTSSNIHHDNNNNTNTSNSIGVESGSRSNSGPHEHGGGRDDLLSSYHPAHQPSDSYRGRGDHMVAATHPGVVNVNHNEPLVCVDDEKVASLVAMDFDADQVVAALRKYDNNVEQALNELLSG